MGSNLSLNITEKSYRVATFNRTIDPMQPFVELTGALRNIVVPCGSIK